MLLASAEFVLDLLSADGDDDSLFIGLDLVQSSLPASGRSKD